MFGVEALEVGPLDTIILQWNAMDMGDGEGPWIPSSEELAGVEKDVREIFPNNKILSLPGYVSFEVVRRTSS